MQNKPNPRPAGVSPAFPAQLCETNPISTSQSQISNFRFPRIIRNEPNLPCRRHPAHLTIPDYAKRTQFQYRWRLAGFSQTQICETNPIRLFPDPNMRNEPNLLPVHDQNVEAKRRSARGGPKQTQSYKANHPKNRNEPNPNEINYKSMWCRQLGEFETSGAFFGELNDEYRAEKCRMSKWYKAPAILVCSSPGPAG